MIKISDYKLIEFKESKNPSQKKSNYKKFFNFKYLYPNINKQPDEWNYENQLKQKYQVNVIQTYQECEQIQELRQHNIFPPSQQIYLLKNKNPNSQRLYISINTIPKNLTLQKVIEYYFNQKLFIPSQIFCTFFIERILKFYDIFEDIRFIFKTITPKKLFMSEDNIYLNYSEIVLLLTNAGSLKIQQNEEQFCAPELLKIIKKQKQGQNMKKQININNDEISKKQSEQQLDNKIYYDVNIGQKLYNKALLYSCGLCILACFKFKLSLQDRYKALRNSKQLKIYLKGWRKQIKLFHQGKFISKLLKLMLEPSENLRDSIQTFRIKMNSAQFNFLKSKINTKELISHNTMKTQSQIQEGNLHNTNRKTIDIHISAYSNGSSINRSWLSTSHVNNTINDKITSPNDYFRDSIQQKKFYSGQKSKISLTKSQINQIKQEGKVKCDSQKSVVDIQVDWDDDSFSKYSQKSKQSKKQSKSSSDDNKNKIKVSINTIQQESLSQEINDTIQFFKKFQMNNQKNYTNKQLYQTEKSRMNNQQDDNKDNKMVQISNTQASKYKNILYYKFQKCENQKDQQKYIQKKEQFVNNLQIKQITKQQEIESDEVKIQQNNKQLQILHNKRQGQLKKKQKSSKLINESTDYNTQSFMSMNKKQSEQLVLQQFSAMDSVYRKNQLISESNLSVVIGQGLLNNNEHSIQIQNKSVFKQEKQNKQIHKYLLKKDKYNSRSRIIILTLFIIYLVYLFIDWFINKNIQKNIQDD